MSRSSGGNSSRVIVRLRPTPITAQPSWGLASMRTPASLRPSTQMSLGHLIRHSMPASSSAAAQTASGTASVDCWFELLGCLAYRERHSQREQEVALVERAEDG